jgi:hypothetical protein
MSNKINNLLNKSSGYGNVSNNTSSSDKSMFSNIYVLMIIAVSSLFFIGYSIYYYLTQSNILNIIANSSYYGKDITLYEALFQENATKMTDCINLCENNILCDGVTYNNDTQVCSGTKNGQIRNESDSFSAWVKPPDSKINNKNNKNNNLDFTKVILVGYTNTPKVVKNTLLQNPYTIGFFAYSFNLTIYDFNKNYGSWRHLFHKGTPIDTNTIMNYQSWENLIVDFPMQSIGVWLAPFTNNLRIAVTTTSSANKNSGSYEDAFIQKCDCLTADCYITDMPGGKWVDKSKSGDNSTPKTKLNTYIEFFDSDLQNIPINKQINITINMQGTDAEVYFDGKIVKVVKLDGVPSISNTNLYVMYDNTFGGEISNLLYYPEPLKLPDVNSILTLAPPSQISSNQ